MAGKVIVGSKLPYSILLRNPMNPQAPAVEIKGLNSAPRANGGALVYIPYATTDVDQDFWDAWYIVHNHKSKPFAALANGSIFVAKTPDAIKGIGRENEGRKTGLEPMPKTFSGVKPADKE